MYIVRPRQTDEPRALWDVCKEFWPYTIYDVDSDNAYDMGQPIALFRSERLANEYVSKVR